MGSALNLSALYMLAGSGALISIKSGDFNLGGEGQIYLGGFVSAIVLARLGVRENLPVAAVLTVALLAVLLASAASALMAGLSALFKIFRQADFLFTSFILSAAIIPLIDGLIAGSAPKPPPLTASAGAYFL